MTGSSTFDPCLEPLLTARVPGMAVHSRRLAEFSDWVKTEVDAQANYTEDSVARRGVVESLQEEIPLPRMATS